MICYNRFVVPKPKWLPNWILLPCHCVVVLTGVVTSPVVLKGLAYVNCENGLENLYCQYVHAKIVLYFEICNFKAHNIQ